AAMHPADTTKGSFTWRLDGLSRAFEAGIDDMGIGALIGLGDWKFDALGLVSHAIYLQKHHGVGPHTISFPRIQPAAGVKMDESKFPNNYEFKKMVAMLRLAVPYTGLILTARESADIRRDLIEFGISQIDAGSRIDIGGYSLLGKTQELKREQFQLGDVRSLDNVVRELAQSGNIPSWCTACYRLGRTGEHFMEFAIPGFIKRYCTPNALSTFTEYLTDYASPETKQVGLKLVQDELKKMEESPMKKELINRLERIQTTDDRDLYF
ncbi:MAG TPA: [FeFe] hydrogenase H-cluster radical SAM maturase HydG, partial [Phycisphaerae bacterium]|nr:[FeFe] hydrogenase H-cluster radical SAM maturase HydG [Phycisphaerae bacterium]